MRDFCTRLKGYVKTMLGICANDGCHKKAIVEVCFHFPSGDIKRCLCAEHSKDFVNKTNSKDVWRW